MRSGGPKRRIYFFIHLTGGDTGNTGIQRVVRNLGRVLSEEPSVDLVPVRWSDQLSAVVHAEQSWRDIISYHNGPIFPPSPDEGKPIHFASFRGLTEDWLLIPEVPHLRSHSAEHPSVSLLPLLGYARTFNYRVGVIFYDLLPITFSTRKSENEIDRLVFTVYGQSLLHADVILGISGSVTKTLWDWWSSIGVRSQLLPNLLSVPLPDEMAFTPRRTPGGPVASFPPGPINFVTWGTISEHKNQIALIDAFNRLCDRRPGLDVRLHMVGHVDPRLERRLGEVKAHSRGRVLTYGYLPDDKLAALIAQCRAVVFVSLAEGFGLPIVESLWAGKPCLCSDTGSMGEIAANGGCLTVPPTDVDAISQGLERFATDIDLYNAKLAEIRHRKLRTWQDYMHDVLNKLHVNKTEIDSHAHPSKYGQQLIKTPQSSHRSFFPNWLRLLDSKNIPNEQNFDIPLDQMKYHWKPEQPQDARLYDGSILRYDSKIHRNVTEGDLFYGPYFSLPSGNYLIKFHGNLTGRITVRLTRAPQFIIKQQRLKSFNTPVEFNLTEDIKDFEIVLIKSIYLVKLEISRISIIKK